MDVLGFDIGGANIKGVYLTKENGEIRQLKVEIVYFPFWRDSEKLREALLSLKHRLGATCCLDGIAITMTAELSDVYQTKREGVNHILSCVKAVFSGIPIFVLTSSVELISLDSAFERPIEVAAANWAATGWLVAQELSNCIVVDVGSTTTSIIPIVDGKVAALGKTDLEKLICGELVYTGSLRTNIAAIVHSIPVRGGIAGVSSELFALSGDVHLILGNIEEVDYTSETADGRGKSVAESLARLARVVCADTEMLSEKDLFQIARYIHGEQIRQVEVGLAKVYSRIKSLRDGFSLVVTGLGKDFIAKRAAEKIGAEIIDLGSLIRLEAVRATPAFAISLMLASRLGS
jgi:probable H4MPT-linked C1 transfer pathway protein